MAGKFEPNKSGDYRVCYFNNNYYKTEIISYDRKTNFWKGSQSNDFYHEKVTSWMTTDGSAIK